MVCRGPSHGGRKRVNSSDDAQNWRSSSIITVAARASIREMEGRWPLLLGKPFRLHSPSSYHGDRNDLYVLLDVAFCASGLPSHLVCFRQPTKPPPAHNRPPTQFLLFLFLTPASLPTHRTHSVPINGGRTTRTTPRRRPGPRLDAAGAASRHCLGFRVGWGTVGPADPGYHKSRVPLFDGAWTGGQDAHVAAVRKE